MGLNDRDEPLSNDLDTLIPIHAAHVGLYRFLKKVSLIVEDDWYREDIHFGASQKCSHESVELGLYLARFAKPGDCRFGVQGG